MRREITGFSNPLLKEVRSLREKKHRKRAGLFLAEVLFRVSGRDMHPLEIVLEDEVLAAGGDVIETSADIMAKLSGKENAQAIVGVYRDHATALMEIDRSSAPIWLVAQAMRDPGNLGTMLRTGDAVGAGGLILIDDCTDPFSVEAVRASMGAIFTQKIVQCRWEEFVPWLRSGDGQLVGTSLQTDTDYRACTYTAPCFILTGNEAQGLPQDYETVCDALVKMPMYGKADSLNAAVATAVMAYQVRGQLE
jgi:RNA methyltransferase, TrmH family